MTFLDMLFRLLVIQLLIHLFCFIVATWMALWMVLWPSHQQPLQCFLGKPSWSCAWDERSPQTACSWGWQICQFYCCPGDECTQIFMWIRRENIFLVQDLTYDLRFHFCISFFFTDGKWPPALVGRHSTTFYLCVSFGSVWRFCLWWGNCHLKTRVDDTIVF